MNCPYCNKAIIAWTGLQELQKFNKHLRTCKKHPGRQMNITEQGLKEQNPPSDLLNALNIRHESGQ